MTEYQIAQICILCYFKRTKKEKLIRCLSLQILDISAHLLQFAVLGSGHV